MIARRTPQGSLKRGHQFTLTLDIPQQNSDLRARSVPLLPTISNTGPAAVSLQLTDVLQAGVGFSQVWTAEPLGAPGTNLVMKIIQPSMCPCPLPDLSWMFNYRDPRKLAHREAWAYQKLADKQGLLIPYFFGIHTVSPRVILSLAHCSDPDPFPDHHSLERACMGPGPRVHPRLRWTKPSNSDQSLSFRNIALLVSTLYKRLGNMAGCSRIYGAPISSLLSCLVHVRLSSSTCPMRDLTRARTSSPLSSDRCDDSTRHCFSLCKPHRKPPGRLGASSIPVTGMNLTSTAGHRTSSQHMSRAQIGMKWRAERSVLSTPELNSTNRRYRLLVPGEVSGIENLGTCFIYAFFCFFVSESGHWRGESRPFSA
ncbi:hypothetical protein DFH06DRAFT_1210042 [Mycena polygramma]|nr:hypothetical protein DFH06DRAFT_1210042 [Mycena polygramma]